MKRRRDRESGVTVVEFVVLTPILFFLMFGSVDIGLALFARHVAVSAAQEGARVAREDAADPNADWQTSSTDAANNWVMSLLGDLVVSSPDTSMARSYATVPLDQPYPQVGVTVNFGIVSLMPGLNFTESASSVGPVECFYTLAGVCDGE